MLTFWLVIASVISAVSQTNNCVIHVEKYDYSVCVYVNPEEYSRLSDVEKTTFVKTQAVQYEVNSISVVVAYDVELWQFEDDTVKKIDTWNKNVVTTLSGNTKETHRRSLQHPWFFNLSGAINLSVDDGIVNEVIATSSTLSYNAYSRLGCYLLKGRWDVALSGMLGYSKPSIDEKGSYSYSVGVDTRVYILKGKAINPFAGVGVAYATSNDETSVTIPLSAGLSIPVKGKGCIDFCYQYNKVTKGALVIGYTYMHK